MNQLGRLAVTFACLLVPVEGVAAESYFALTNRYAKAASNTFHEIIEPRILQVMSPDEKVVLQSIEFKFPAGGGAFDAFAARKHGQRFILIAGGFVLFQDSLADAATIASRFHRSDQIVGYVAAASEDGRQNVARLRIGEAPEPVISPERYFAIDIGSYRQSEDYNRRMAFLRTDGLAMIIGHEVAHHLHGDVDVSSSDSEQMEREAKADKYAMELGLRAGFSPITATPLMMGFIEGGEDASHPAPQCRWANYMIVAMHQADNDTGFASYLAANPEARAIMSRSKQVLAENADEMAEDCGKWLIQRP